MKPKNIVLAGFLACMLLGGFPVSAQESSAEAEWTVLFYLCGSDLESKYGFASENLKEISEAVLPSNYQYAVISEENILLDVPPKVNVVIETGGSREWHTEELGIDISGDALQRWYYNYYPDDLDRTDLMAVFSTPHTFELQETLPSQSMADPEVLSDFIVWGKERYPAKKYALVLWDHGLGSKAGIIVDDCYDGDVMYLYELKEALEEGGTEMEAVIIDACQMAGIETAWTLKDHAKWMIASEENVPGKGTAFKGWMQELFNHPECDGRWLGRRICDLTGVRYAEENDETGKLLMTWSVIDLGKIDALTEALENIFIRICQEAGEYPETATSFAYKMREAEDFGDGRQHMRDLGSLFYQLDGVADFAELRLRNDVIDAIAEAVVYNVRGSGRTDSYGISFCYPSDCSDEELDIYARNYPVPGYLAFLDMFTDWKAPDWVYEAVETVPDLSDLRSQLFDCTLEMCDNGLPGVAFESGYCTTNRVRYNLYQRNEDSGQTVWLGKTNCSTAVTEDDRLLFYATDPMHWPSIEGKLCTIELVQSKPQMRLYNIPIMIGTEPLTLRCGRTISYEDDGARISVYEIYGLWEEYEEDTTLFTRSVKPLAEVTGQDYRLLHPVDGTGLNGGTEYETSDWLTMYRSLEVAEIPLPPGTYYLEYEIENVFMQKTTLDRIELYWDGENIAVE